MYNGKFQAIKAITHIKAKLNGIHFMLLIWGRQTLV